MDCVVTRQLWLALRCPIGLVAIIPGSDDELGEWWLRHRMRLHPDARYLPRHSSGGRGLDQRRDINVECCVPLLVAKFDHHVILHSVSSR